MTLNIESCHLTREVQVRSILVEISGRKYLYNVETTMLHQEDHNLYFISNISKGHAPWVSGVRLTTSERKAVRKLIHDYLEIEIP